MRWVVFLLIFLLFTSCSNKAIDGKTEVLSNDKLEKDKAITENNILDKDEINNQKSDNIKFKKILFIGDSHIASDYMSNYFRNALNIHYLGFIPPDLPKWHNQYLVKYNNENFNINYLINTKNNLAFSGINAVCNNDCKININLDFTPKNIEYLELKNNIWSFKKYTKITQNINFNVKNNTTIGGFFSNNQTFIDSIGINGASIFNYDRINKNIQKIAAKKLNYDLVIFSFGTNESVADTINSDEFLFKFNNLIKIFNSAKIILLIPPEPVIYKDKVYVKGKNNDNIKKLIKKLAEQNQVNVFDIDELMQKEGGKQEWIKQNKSLKNTHLTKQGYDYVASKLLKYLDKI